MPFLADSLDITVDDAGTGATSGAATAITGIISITPPAPKVGVYDSTHLNTTAGTITKAPLSRIDPGQIQWVMWNENTERTRMHALHTDVHAFVITYPSNPTTTDSFSGVVTEIVQGEYGHADPMKLTVTVEILGAITRT